MKISIVLSFVVFISLYAKFSALKYPATRLYSSLSKRIRQRLRLQSVYSKSSVNIFNSKILLFVLSPIYFLLMNSEESHASPFDPQAIVSKGPFFQGWLFRGIDHKNQISFILIIGSFSSTQSNVFDQNYIYCGTQNSSDRYCVDVFPSQNDVSITKGNSDFNMEWKSNKYGYFKLFNDKCEAHLQLNQLQIKFTTSNRVPWQKNKPVLEGPEGWLGYTSLLPCHYYIYSTGSACNYSISINSDSWNCKSLNSRTKYSLFSQQTGDCLMHIEGNYGSFFPSGWIWAQTIAPHNQASLSIVAGRFTIGSVTSLNFVLYFRYDNETYIFRSTDLARFTYDINGITGVTSISSENLLGNRRIDIQLIPIDTVSSSEFGEPIYIPTAHGFSNKPGCRETYTACAVVTLKKYSEASSNYSVIKNTNFPMTALEYGGSFQNKVFSNLKKFSKT